MEAMWKFLVAVTRNQSRSTPVEVSGWIEPPPFTVVRAQLSCTGVERDENGLHASTILTRRFWPDSQSAGDDSWGRSASLLGAVTITHCEVTRYDREERGSRLSKEPLCSWPYPIGPQFCTITVGVQIRPKAKEEEAKSSTPTPTSAHVAQPKAKEEEAKGRTPTQTSARGAKPKAKKDEVKSRTPTSASARGAEPKAKKEEKVKSHISTPTSRGAVKPYKLIYVVAEAEGAAGTSCVWDYMDPQKAGNVTPVRLNPVDAHLVRMRTDHDLLRCWVTYEGEEGLDKPRDDCAVEFTRRKLINYHNLMLNRKLQRAGFNCKLTVVNPYPTLETSDLNQHFMAMVKEFDDLCPEDTARMMPKLAKKCARLRAMMISLATLMVEHSG